MLFISVNEDMRMRPSLCAWIKILHQWLYVTIYRSTGRVTTIWHNMGFSGDTKPMDICNARRRPSKNHFAFHQVFCGVSSEPNSKSTAAFAWGDNTVGCLGLPAAGSSAVAAAMQPVPVEPVGMLPGERIVAVACSER